MTARVTLKSEYGRSPDFPGCAIYKSTPTETDGKRDYSQECIYESEKDNFKYIPEPITPRIVISTLLKAVLIVIGGCLLAVIPFAAFVSLANSGSRSQVTGVSMLGLLTCVMGLVRYSAKYCTDRLSFRSPVVFLRSHDDDRTTLPKGLFDAESLLSSYTVPGQRRHDMEVEEVLHEELKFCGPTVALTSPSGEDHGKLSVFRFGRHNVAVSDWQQFVLQKLIQARLVAVLLPTTRSLSDSRWGVGWELDTLRKIDRPEKVVIFIPPHSPETIAERWATLREFGASIGIQIPAELPTGCDVCVFSRDWVGTIVRHGNSRNVGALRKTIRRLIFDPDLNRRRLRRGMLTFYVTTALSLFVSLIVWFFVPKSASFGTFALASIAGSIINGVFLGGLVALPKSVS
jgi:hypothetical protein